MQGIPLHSCSPCQCRSKTLRANKDSLCLSLDDGKLCKLGVTKNKKVLLLMTASNWIKLVYIVHSHLQHQKSYWCIPALKMFCSRLYTITLKRPFFMSQGSTIAHPYVEKLFFSHLRLEWIGIRKGSVHDRRLYSNFPSDVFLGKRKLIIN